MERSIFGTSVADRKRSTWIREKTNITDAVERIASLKLSWAGHDKSR